MTYTERKMLVPTSKHNIKCPFSMTAEGYCVHNTANDASANNEANYMLNNNNNVSFHYVVDDKEVIQCIPENLNAWHAGDGRKGNGNRKYIGVEICYSKSGGARFTAAEKNAAQFIAKGLNAKGWGIDRVKKHQDFSGKYCPHRTLDLGWQRFLNLIKSYMCDNSNPSNPTKPTTGKLEPYSGYITVTYCGKEGLSYHKTPDFNSSSVAGTVKKGTVLTVVGRIKADGGTLYQTKAGWYITASEKYVKYSKTTSGGIAKPSQKPSPYYPKYTGNSYGVDTVLKAIGVPEKFRGSWSKRKPIASANGISGYKGSSTQNNRIVSLAKQGKLKKV